MSARFQLGTLARSNRERKLTSATFPPSALCEYVFDERGCVREALEPEGGLRGQSIVCRRGNKAMNVGSTMAM